jgi:hypothetical protein
VECSLFVSSLQWELFSLDITCVCGCCSPANSDSIDPHYQFIYSLPELLRDIHQTRARGTSGFCVAVVSRTSQAVLRRRPAALGALGRSSAVVWAGRSALLGEVTTSANYYPLPRCPCRRREPAQTRAPATITPQQGWAPTVVHYSCMIVITFSRVLVEQ